MSFFRRKSEKKREHSAGVKRSPVLSPSQNQAPSPVSSRSPGVRNGGFGLASPYSEEESASGSGTEPCLLLLEEASHPGDLGVSARPSELQMATSSRLSKSLQELVADREALPYLVQYLETKKAGNLIRFWLDADSFQAATWTRIRTQSLNIVSKSSLIKRKPSAKNTASSKSDTQGTPGEPSTVNADETETENASDGPSIPGLPVASLNQEDADITSPASLSPQNCDSSSLLNERGIPNIRVDSSEQNSGKVMADDSADPRAREKCKSGGLPVDENCVVAGQQAGDVTVADDSGGEHLASGAETVVGRSDADPTQEPQLNTSAIQKPASLQTKAGKQDLGEKLKRSVEQDAVRVFTKYLAQDASHPIGITDDLRNEAIRKICQEDGDVHPECFVDCQTFALQQIEERFYSDFKDSLYHCKHQVDILTSGQLYLSDILYNDTAFFYFMEYMEREGLSHLLQFWMAIENFQQTLDTQQGQYDGMEAQGDAMVLYDKYFSLQAAQPLGFPDAIRFEVESNICREEGPLPDCFSKPREIVLHTLKKLHFSRYLQSDVYYRYLSELVSSAQSAQDFPIEQRKRRGSEASSEHSVGSVGGESVRSKNTLLATGQPLTPQSSKLREETIDSNLLNPDLLWRRPESGNMTLGKIDTLGGFVSNFVPDPDSSVPEKKKTAGSSRFFKSKKDKEKEQEEMARRVAEMILNDVKSVTQTIGEMKNPPESQEDQE